MTRAQSRLLHTLLGNLTIDSRDDKLRALTHLTGREITTSNNLTAPEFRKVIEDLQSYLTWEEPDRIAQVDILTRPSTDPWASDRPAA